MENDERILLTKEINDVLKKYHVKGTFMAVVLPGHKSGMKYDDAFLLRGQSDEVVEAIQNATEQNNGIHDFVDMLVMLHTNPTKLTVKSKTAN